MKQDSDVINSYRKEVERLRSCSPEWKPITLRAYIEEHKKSAIVKSKKLS